MIDIIFDIEIFPNYFLLCSEEVVSHVRKSFEISQYRDDRKEMMEYIFSKEEPKVMFGYNNIGYDSRLLSRIITNYKWKGKALVEDLKKFSDNIIKSDVYRNYTERVKSVLNIDLMLIHHFNNEAKRCSLKDLEFAMRMKNIQDLPFHHNKILTKSEQEEVREYCWNDIEATLAFYHESFSKIQFRERMGKIYNLSLANYNDVKIGEVILKDELQKTIPDIHRMRTHRQEMKMEEIILPIISFDSIEFNTLLEWWRDKVITQTKGQFSELDLDYVAPLLPYCNNKLKKGKLAKLNILYKGVQFDFGTGGIHGVCGSGIWREDDEYELILVDVSSYYPNLARFMRFHPEHIPVEIFVEMIVTLYNQRMKGKADGDDEIVSAIKLALNGALYGKSNSEYSFMFDPMFMMKICVNGQLLLVSLAEKLMNAGMELIQINTDGILVKLKRTDRAILDKFCNEWMQLTSLKLDYDHFSLVVQKDVNNYLAVHTNGKIKEKGAAFTTKPEWYQNHSSLVVQKALHAYFIDNKDPSEFLEEHDNIFDFFIRGKVRNIDKLVMRSEEGDIQIQKTCRYLVTTEGIELVKIMPPTAKQEIRETRLEAGWKCTVHNDLRGVDLERLKESIDYSYYLLQINKIIETIEYKESNTE